MSWREDQHPRWPAETSGGRGGEFRPAAGGWVQGVLEQMELPVDTPEQDLRRTVHVGRETGRTHLAGGATAETEIVDFTMPDGSTRRLVTKTSNAADVHREVLASAIAREMGAPVPVVIPDTHLRSRLWMPLVDGYSPMQRLKDDYIAYDNDYGGVLDDDDEDDPDEDDDPDAFDWEGFWDYAQDEEHEIIEEYAHGRDGQMLGLLDLLLRNSDRHIGNWLIRPVSDEVVGIDHTHIDLHTHLDVDDEVAGHWFGSPFTQPLLVASETTGDIERVDWHPADVAELERRLDKLFARPEIRRLFDELSADPEVILSRLRWVGHHANPDAERRYQ